MTIYKSDHQMAPLALVANFATTLPWVALLALSVSIDLVSSSARFTSVKFQKPLSVTENRTHRSDQGDLGPIKIASWATSPSRAMNWSVGESIVIYIVWSMLGNLFKYRLKSHLEQLPQNVFFSSRILFFKEEIFLYGKGNFLFGQCPNGRG